jgi:anti-sigma-K factor RskA
MTSLSETSLRPAPPAVEDLDALGPTFSAWKSVEIPEPRRPSPAPLVVLGLLAGIAAMAVGAVAVVSAARSVEEPAPPAPATAAATLRVEQQVLALLAKPSTDRVVFHGSGGQLLLVVGSAGRAAILVRGFERAPAGRPYRAWVVGAGKPVRAGTFTGAERAVFLSVPVLRQERVVIARDRAAALRPSSKLVAARG